jgi:hypothetical protein
MMMIAPSVISLVQMMTVKVALFVIIQGNPIVKKLIGIKYGMLIVMI